MKILILNPILYTADNNVIPEVKSIKDTMIYNMCLGFRKLGHDVTLAAAADYKPMQQEVYDFDVRWFKTVGHKFCPPSVLPYSTELKSFLKQHSNEYDMVMTSEVFSFWSLMAARICPEKTVIWHELALHPHKFHQIPSKVWYNTVARYLMRNVLVVPRSEDAKRFVCRYMRTVSHQCVEHGIDLSQFKCGVEKKKQFIVVSQLVARKNIDGIIRIFKRFVEKYDAAYKLLIVGRGVMEEELKSLTHQLGLDGKVEFLGFKSHEEMNDYLPYSQAMLINTRQDNNMVSIPESIVSGTPVVTNTVPTNSSMVAKQRLGIVKDGWDEDTLGRLLQITPPLHQNCLQNREMLSSQHQASLLVEQYLKFSAHEDISTESDTVHEYRRKSPEGGDH